MLSILGDESALPHSAEPASQVFSACIKLGIVHFRQVSNLFPFFFAGITKSRPCTKPV
jgi:hypothetical protein